MQHMCQSPRDLVLHATKPAGSRAAWHAMCAPAQKESRDREGSVRAMTSAVLIVEDDNDIAAVYAELFTTEGYEVLAGFDGRQALAIVTSQPVDLMVSDIRMPHMDGITLATEVRRLGFDFPIMLVSAVESQDQLGHLANVTFLKKPVSIGTLVDTAASLLSRRGLGSPARPD